MQKKSGATVAKKKRATKKKTASKKVPAKKKAAVKPKAKPTNPKPEKPVRKEDGPPDHIELFYDIRDGSGFWFCVKGRWVKMAEKHLKRHFFSMGLRDDIWHNHIREVEWPFWFSMMNKQVEFAGKLSGYRTGPFTDSAGRSYLITSEATGVFDAMPKKCALPKWFIKFVQELLPGDQWLILCHWLRIALESLRKGDLRPGQVMALAGPPQCGKSLLQYIVTEILGGRSANPFRYMMGETQFNGDVAGAEHWMIEDPSSSTDIRTRRLFAAKLKECTVNRDFSVHPKGKEAELLALFRRITLSVNDEQENLMVIPPLDASIVDKFFLLKCEVANVGGDREKTWATVLSEITAIRFWLLNKLPPVPKEFHDDRFGIAAWHHPDLMQILQSVEPHVRFLEIVDHVLFETGPVDDRKIPFVGKAIELEKQLRGSKFSFEADKILKHTNSCGNMLGKLAAKNADRVTLKSKPGGSALWQILPPKTKDN